MDTRRAVFSCIFLIIALGGWTQSVTIISPATGGSVTPPSVTFTVSKVGVDSVSLSYRFTTTGGVSNQWRYLAISAPSDTIAVSNMAVIYATNVIIRAASSTDMTVYNDIGGITLLGALTPTPTPTPTAAPTSVQPQTVIFRQDTLFTRAVRARLLGVTPTMTVIPNPNGSSDGRLYQHGDIIRSSTNDNLYILKSTNQWALLTASGASSIIDISGTIGVALDDPLAGSYNGVNTDFLMSATFLVGTVSSSGVNVRLRSEPAGFEISLTRQDYSLHYPMTIRLVSPEIILTEDPYDRQTIAAKLFADYLVMP